MTAPTHEQNLDRSDMTQRPPHGVTRRPSGKPLVVTPVFLARSDDTPWGERVHDEGWAVGTDGKMVRDPDRNPSRLALEGNPNLAFEHWGEYWRKVHGVKYAYQEPGASNAGILRYDQVHRIASGPHTGWVPPYRAMVDDDGKLARTPSAQVPPYHRVKWDGIAYIAFESEEEARATLAQEQYTVRFTADEQVLFRKVTNDMAHEHILIASERHREPVSLVKIHVRKAGLSRGEFQRRLLEEHADIVMGAGATGEYVTRYVQLHPFASLKNEPESQWMDGISIFSFASLNDLEDYMASTEYARVAADEARLVDPTGSEFWSAVNYSVVNRLAPELATHDGGR